MILDEMRNAGKYYSLHPSFELAFDFIRRPDLSGLKNGRYEIDGDRVYASVDRPVGRGEVASPLEAHRRYIDIQYVIKGTDRIGYRPLSLCREVSRGYDEGKDIVFFSDPVESWFAVHEGRFAIFFPGDAHAPLAGEGEIIKVVVKIAVS